MTKLLLDCIYLVVLEKKKKLITMNPIYLRKYLVIKLIGIGITSAKLILF